MLQTIFTQILNMSITAGYIIPAILLVRLIIRKTPKKFSYLLWSVAAFRLSVPISFSSVFSLFSVNPYNIHTVRTEENGTLSCIPPSAAPFVPENTNTMINNAVQNTTPSLEAGAVDKLYNILPYIWISVAALLLLYGFLSYFTLKIKMRNAVLKEKNIYESSNVSSPFILGFITPKIYIPFHTDEKTYQYITAHEACHLKRYDHYIKAFAFILLAVHWFNPLCWLAFKLMTADMEMSCDEKVLAEKNEIRKEYSTALLSFAAKQNSISAAPLCFCENSVKARIKNVLKFKKPKLIISIITGILCLTVIIGCALNPLSEPVDAEEPAKVSEADLPPERDDTNIKIEQAFKSFDTPGISSNPYDYIDKESEAYKYLITNKDDTIAYIYAKFLDGGQYDIYGHFYKIVMDDIIGEETLKCIYGTGQEYFDEFIKHNKKMLYENGEVFMKKNLPYGYLLLEMSHSSSNTIQVQIISNQIKSIKNVDVSEYNSITEMISAITSSEYIDKFGNGVDIYKFRYNDYITFYLSFDVNNKSGFYPIGITYYLNDWEYAYQNLFYSVVQPEITTQSSQNKSDKSENVKLISSKDAIKHATNEIKKDKYSEYLKKISNENIVQTLCYRPTINNHTFKYDDSMVEYAYDVEFTINNDDNKYNECKVMVNAENGDIISIFFYNTYDMV